MTKLKQGEVRDVHVAIRMGEKEVAYLDNFASKLNLTRSQLIRNLIETGLDDMKLAQTFGLISLVGFIRDNKIKAKDVVGLAMD